MSSCHTELPLISILITTYNRKEYISAAIDSALKQTYKNIELIIADDGSTDATGELIQEKYKDEIQSEIIKYFYNQNQGIIKTRNYLLNKVKSKWITFLDSDDYFSNEKVEKQFNYVVNHPDSNIVFTYYDVIRSNKTKDGKIIDVNEGIEHDPIYLPSALINTSLFEKYGYFDESIEVADDYEWMARIKISGEDCSGVIKEPLYFRRIHENNLSKPYDENRSYIINNALVHAIRNKKR